MIGWAADAHRGETAAEATEEGRQRVFGFGVSHCEPPVKPPARHNLRVQELLWKQPCLKAPADHYPETVH